MKRVLTVVGARPQFIKAAPLSARLRSRFHEVLVHTGQHYDARMSELFFGELSIPEPDVNLAVGSSGHADQTGRMKAGILEVVREVAPDLVMVYGDTNSTLAGALAAAEARVPLAHVEAGLRSGNLSMPEEVNRIAADHLSDLCLCPTAAAVECLRSEGIGARGRLVGDVMLDACLAARVRDCSDAIERLGLSSGEYAFATIHRPSNTDDREVLRRILDGLGRLSRPVVLPLHPRTRVAIRDGGLPMPGSVNAVEPLSYGDTIALLSRAWRAITDSGGLQKEAYFLSTPCVTVRGETEWPETVASGWNRLVAADAAAIREAVEDAALPDRAPDLDLFGGGRACERIVGELERLASDSD